MRAGSGSHSSGLGLIAAIVACGLGSNACGAAGRTATQFDVSQSGEAVYSIPVFTPPGTHGMTPQLALVYGHRNGSTLLGAGWSIAGLSAIARCPSSWAADGVPRAIRNDGFDRFCLDGNKLRLTAGTYGQAGATYQTEIETFSRATSYGQAGNGPAYFIVERKDGLIYEYGNTADSRIESVGQPTARTWAVNAIRDRAGNSITFTYAEDTTNGAYRIDLVQYTSNATAGLSAAYQIDFAWQTKPTDEIDSGYIAGSVVKEITRLDRIDVTYNDTLVRRYSLNYEPALSSTSKSRLASVQECAGAALDCLPATTFTYRNGTPGLNSEVNTGDAVPATPWPLDVNGDGRDDLVYSSSEISGSGHWRVMLAGASGYGSAIDTGVINTNHPGAIPIDYNADGFEDLLVPYSGGTWWVMLGSTSGLSAPTNTGAPAPATGTNARAFDVNGDGLEDLLWAELHGYAGGDAIRYRLREWGGAFSSTVSNLVGPFAADAKMSGSVFSPVGQPAPRRTPDFNGDGRGDLVYRSTQRVWIDGPNIWKFFYRMNVLCPGAWGFTIADPQAAGAPYFGDFNGDGKSDLLYLDGNGLVMMRFSTGTGFTGEIQVGGLGAGDWAILDWDSDGKDDLLLPSGSTLQLLRSTGEGFATAVNTSIPTSAQVAVADIDGDGLFDFGTTVSGTWRYRMHAGTFPDLLQTATDGYGNTVTFTYAPLTSANYSKYADASFPEQDYQGPLYVVNSYSASDGIGGTYTNSLWYYGARVHLQGRGFEGFYAQRTHDSRNGLYAYSYFHRLFPYTGALYDHRLYQSDRSTFIARVQNTWTVHSYGSGYESRYLPYISQSVAKRYEAEGSFDAALISTATTNNSVDSATGTLYDSTTTTVEASTANGVQAGASYVQRVYQPATELLTDWTHWCFGRPQRVQAINSHNQYGGSAITRTTTMEWDTAKCRPTKVTTEPGNAQLQVTRVLGYDTFGNVDSDAVTGIGMPARTTSTDWGAKGQFPESTTNALSQVTSFDWDPALGVKTGETDPNGVPTSWDYDAFGRRTREDRPDGTATTWSYDTCASGCVNSNNKMVVTQTLIPAAGGTPVVDQKVYLDRFDRPIVTAAISLAGAYNRIDREYDALGRIERQSAPCWWSACTQYWTDFSYDLLDRVTQISRPISDGNATVQTTNSYYEGLTTRVVDALGKQSARIANVAGGLARSTDHDGYSQSFDVEGFGNVVRVTDSLGNTLLSNTFNLRGMRTAQNDLAAGNWSYIPDALGEVTSQTDAKAQTTTFEYDLLGRMKKRTEAEGVSTWNWGTLGTAHNIGRLASMAGPGYSEGYAYDGIGRLATTTIASDATYSIDYTYNLLGALDTLTYPTSTAGYRLKLQYDYQNGQLQAVRDYNAPATVFWSANDTDARGNVISETLGNGIQTIRGFDSVTGWIDFIQSGAGGAIQNLSYEWNAVGSLRERLDVRQGLTETFYYDNLHRLTSTTGPDPISIGYDPRGNILSRSGGHLGIGNGHTITWTSYNLPDTITDVVGNNASQFFYAPDRSRFKQVASYGGTSVQTIYIGGLVEKVTLGSITSWRHYISGASGPVAIYTRKSSGSNEVHYLTNDHLGSIDSVTDAAGNLEVRLSFGASGERRKENGWSGNPTSSDWTQITDTTRRGFTSHEMLDNLNLTHMNGRVYDQLIGQFISPDPFIDGPGSTQGWNRYAYVHGNPLSYTDPSGYKKGTIVQWINGPELPQLDGTIETVTVSASRYDMTRYNYAAADFQSNVRASPPDGIGGGGGANSSNRNDNADSEGNDEEDDDDEPDDPQQTPQCEWQETSGNGAVTFGGYLGVGFEITAGEAQGNGFFTFRFGFGVGGGISYNPQPAIPGPEVANRNSSGWVLSDSGQLNFNAGPIGANAELGVARNYSNEESSFYGGLGAGATSYSEGLGASASFGGQVTHYSGRTNYLPLQPTCHL